MIDSTRTLDVCMSLNNVVLGYALVSNVRALAQEVAALKVKESTIDDAVRHVQGIDMHMITAKRITDLAQLARNMFDEQQAARDAYARQEQIRRNQNRKAVSNVA